MISLKNILLFGGSFNPPHLGHRQVLEHLTALLGYDEVWVIPSFSHPFEKGLAPFDKRVLLCEKLILDLNSKIRLCLIEGELKKSPSYFIDILLALKKQNLKAQFTIALGSDCKNTLHQWKDSKKLSELARFYFFPRAGYEDSPFLQISSSEIRELIRQKKDVTTFVDKKILDIIMKEKMYEGSS